MTIKPLVKSVDSLNQKLTTFWSLSEAEALQFLETSPSGLTKAEAQKRRLLYGFNILKARKQTDWWSLFLAQFKSPIILILLFAAILAFFLHDQTEAIIIIVILLVSSILGFWQERRATNAVAKLLAMVQIKATIIRNGNPQEIPVEEVVPGDIVILDAGDSIPGDCLILESKDLFADEATLTGETFPVEKSNAVMPAVTPLAGRSNALFMGTHIVSGDAKALVIVTGKQTEFGKISQHLNRPPVETDFEHGIRHFGYFLMEITLILIIAIFAINVFLQRSVMESFLFSLALAVGLTPQLLPAIISINLAHGAATMTQHKVIVKRLASIENFGSMNVLCSDKTGTLTEGLVKVHSTTDIDGNISDKVLLYAYLNAYFEAGFTNPIDKAILNHHQFDISDFKKLDEAPYDFVRKLLSILVSDKNGHLIVTKGALPNVLAVCSSVETPQGIINITDALQQKIRTQFEEYSSQGFRVLGIAYRNIGTEATISKTSEAAMVFLGFLLLFDPPKTDIAATLKSLRQLGITVKIVTGDNRYVTAHVSQQVGFTNPRIITGHDLNQMADTALVKQVNNIDAFAEVEPNQKERIILALKKSGNVVGYMGDGINDAPSLHAADIGISIDTATDAAKDAADIVLLEKDLNVLVNGVQAGRMTFANTLKYIFMATSANFGNMFSMAGISIFLTFLPLLPKQILLTNLLTDFPEMTIATDSVDKEMVEKPQRWNIKYIRNFMITFGILSSIFDYLTFGALLLILNATEQQFRTGWFIESVISAAMIVLVIRSRRLFFKSKPGKYLLLTTLIVILVTLLLPFTPVGTLFGFTPLPIEFFLLLAIILVLYITAAEITKRFFYKRARL